MRTRASSLFSSLLPFALLAALCGAVVPPCSSHACGTVGCVTGAAIQLTLPPPTATTFPLAVRTCFNADCRTAQLASAEDLVGGPSTATFPSTPPTPEGPSANAMLSLTGAGSLALVVAWSQNPSSHVANGDRYTVTVTDAGGATLASLDKTATYVTSQPNGEDCGPTCQYAMLD